MGPHLISLMLQSSPGARCWEQLNIYYRSLQVLGLDRCKSADELYPDNHRSTTRQTGEWHFTTGGWYRWMPVHTYHEGTPSAERSFTIDYNPVITLLEPANKPLPTFTPTFRWSAVRGAQRYQTAV